MRILGIETSSRRGSVALLDHGRISSSQLNEEPEAHAERTVQLIEQVLRQSELGRSDIDRVAVGCGPGSFTGLRVGIALAQGIACALAIDLIGIPSQRAMANAVPNTVPGLRCSVIDARREDLFVAVHTLEGQTLVAPRTIAVSDFASFLAQLPGGGVTLGRALRERELDRVGQPRFTHFASIDCDYASAAQVALLAGAAEVEVSTAQPLYIHDARATLPSLPPTPPGI